MLETLVSLLVFLGVLSVLIIVHEFGHFLAARRAGVRVETFSIGFGPALFKKKIGSTDYCIGSVPLGGYVKLAGDNLEEYKGSSDEFYTKPVGKRFGIVAAGPLFNYLLGFLLFWLVFATGFESFGTRISGVLEGYGAAEAGLAAGDRILALNETSVTSADEVITFLRGVRAPYTVRVSFERDGVPMEMAVNVRRMDVDDQMGGRRTVSMLGVTFDTAEVVVKRFSVPRAFAEAVRSVKGVTVMTYKGLWRMMIGRISFKDSVTGPLGIFDMTSSVAKLGIMAVVNLMALLSVSLALFNVLPLPVLDGGHLFFLLVEKIRGKPVSTKVERAVSQVSMAFLIFFALFVTYFDLLKLMKKG
jgi:regulator of sigma E protease